MIKTKTITIKISQEQYELLEKLCEESFVKKSEYVRLKLFKGEKNG
jgi:hypothetical protein